MDRILRLVLVLTIAAPLGGAAWWLGSMSTPTPLQIVVLARGTADQDLFVSSFVQSFQARHPSLSAHTKVLPVSVPIDKGLMLETLREVAELKPALWVAQNGLQAQAARSVDPQIPLVFSIQADPVALGIASDLIRRTEPTVGLWINDDLDAKRLEMLIDAYPSLHHFGVIATTEWVQSAHAPLQAMQKLAATRGVTVQFVVATTTDEAVRASDSENVAKVQAWCLPRTGLSLTAQLLNHLASQGKPVITANPQDVHGNAQMSYTFMPGLVAPTLADLAARIIQGEHAGSIPIQMPHRFQFAVRVGPDRGLPDLNPEVVRRADLVIK